MTHLSSLWRTGAPLTAVVVLAVACNYGEVVVVQPAATGHGPLTLSIQADPEDTAVARELGWSAGIPCAEVTISPGNSDTATGPPVAVLQTDTAGAASVPDLPDGNYLVEVRRLLTASETPRLSPGEDVVGFFAKAVVKRGPVTLQAPASRRHSVVISEWAFQPGWIPGASAWYYFGGYLKLVNNGDTTVYLDGLVIGEGFARTADFVTITCTQVEGLSNDPDGIWSRYFDSLPGTGRTYPLAPGATAVIATDAIDHSGIVPGGLDLSHADFEFVGTADVDNPDVPNSISIGPRDYWFGHGLFLNELLAEVVFIALPVDVASLPIQTTSYDQNQYRRVPRTRILDAIALLSTFQFLQPLCPHLVHRNFDRYRARLIVDEPWSASPGLHSVHRKVGYTRPDGRMVLQDTRTSNADLYIGPRNPWGLP